MNLNFLYSVPVRIICGLALLAILVPTSGCHDPTAKSVDAGSGAAKKEKKVVKAESDLEFVIDGDNCDIKFTGSNAVGQTPFGFFYKLDGKVIVDSKTKQLKHFEVLIDMNEAQAMSESLTKKLKTKGFFQVDQFPSSRFVSTAVSNGKRDGDPEETTNVVEGNFQLRDVTKSIKFPVTVSLDGGKLKLVSEFKINRKDYGVVYSNSIEDKAIRDDVLLNIEMNVEQKK